MTDDVEDHEEDDNQVWSRLGGYEDDHRSDEEDGCDDDDDEHPGEQGFDLDRPDHVAMDFAPIEDPLDISDSADLRLAGSEAGGMERRHPAPDRSYTRDDRSPPGSGERSHADPERIPWTEVAECEAILQRQARLYVSCEQPTIAELQQSLRSETSMENRRRSVRGLPPVTCPSWDTLAREIARLDQYEVCVARHGRRFAKHRFGLRPIDPVVS